jgi:FtsZ-interacting cell division protein YlmF
MIRRSKGLAALLVVTVAAALAVGAPASGDRESTGNSPNGASDLRSEYPLRDQKQCCSAEPTQAAATVKAPPPGPQGEGDRGVPLWPLLLIALAGWIALAFLLGAFVRAEPSRLAASVAAVPRAIWRVDLRPVATAASAVPRAIRGIDLGTARRRRDRSGDADRRPDGHDQEARERRRTSGVRALRLRHNRSRQARVAARPKEPSVIMEPPDQFKDEPEVARAEVYRVAPRTFREAQEIAGGFSRSVPVVLDLRTTEPALADRLIDFASGLVFGLGGTMEEIAKDLLLILPPDAEISAEQAARLRDPRSFES